MSLLVRLALFAVGSLSISIAIAYIFREGEFTFGSDDDEHIDTSF